MTERMDLLSARSYTKDGETKTAFTKIGVAFATKNGGWSLSFEALPLPSLSDKGTIETRVLMMPPREQAPASAPTRQGKPAFESAGDDDIPWR